MIFLKNQLGLLISLVKARKKLKFWSNSFIQSLVKGKIEICLVPKCNKSDLPSLNITTPGIEKLLKEINVSKSVGPDNISNAILKNCASQLAPGLSGQVQNKGL